LSSLTLRQIHPQAALQRRLLRHDAQLRMLQQSAQTVTKGLADEVGQKDAADASLLNKLMEMVLQIMQSRAAASAIR